MIAQKIYTGRKKEVKILKLKLKFPLLMESELNMLLQNPKQFN
jgi:hypothetical protein